MRPTTFFAVLVSLLLSAAIFGFFYAWVCSTMWGLDAADPRVAIAAMQAMNASVRNMVFAPAFFGTPFALLLAAALLWREGYRRATTGFCLAGLLCLCLGMGLTLTINVPMNEALARVSLPDDIETARAIWATYSPDWQFWNQMRTVATGLAFLLACSGLLLDLRGLRAAAPVTR